MAFQIDHRQLTRPPEPSAFARGASHLGNVLDAIMARREQKRQFEADQEAQAQRAQAIRAEQAQRLKVEDARARAKMQQDAAAGDRDFKLKQQQSQAGVFKDVTGMLGSESGQAAALPYLQAAGVGVRQSQGRQARPSVVEEDGGEITSSIPQTAEEAGTYLQFAGGNEARLPLDQMLPAAEAERVQRALSGLPASDPMVARQLALVSPLVAAGLSPKDAVSAGSGLYDDTAAMERAKVRGRGAGGPGRVDPRKAQMLKKGNLDIETKFDNFVQKVLQNKGYKELRTQEVKLGDMAATIAGASDSAALAALGSGQFVKMAQGGVGVISDNDMKVFWSRIGGLGVRGEQAFHDAMNGRLGPEKKKGVLAAVRQLESKASANIDDIGRAIVDRLKGVEGGQERTETYLRTYAPGYLDKWQSGRAGAGDAGALESMEAEADEWTKGLR